jgi:hypothetical protein
MPDGAFTASYVLLTGRTGLVLTLFVQLMMAL